MEGSGEEVNDFLLRIRELGNRRDKEDDEIARKLEADILAGREARRARRDERARSLSPQKDSPLGTPVALKGSLWPDDPPNRVSDSSGAALEKLTGKLADATTGSGAESVTSASPESKRRRATTLSWQRRPKSMHANYIVPKPAPDTLSDNEPPEKSRAQITESLETKKPDWFRQAEDRAVSSKPLKRPEEIRVGGASRMALPGMSPSESDLVPRTSTPEPQKGLPRTSYEPRTARPARSGSLKSERPELGRSPSVLSNVSGRFELESNEGFSRASSMSPSQERILPGGGNRTPSPTKGFGGFVQSAMLKREGSINKRWSRPEPIVGNGSSGGGISRTNSAVNSRSSYAGNAFQDAPILAHISREASPAPVEDYTQEVSRSEAKEIGRITTRARSNTTGDGFVGRTGDRPTSFLDEQKKWSPTKSSWLESALKKGTDNPQPPLAPAKPLERTSSKYTTDRKIDSSSPFDKPSLNIKPVPSPKPIQSQEALKKHSERSPDEPIPRLRERSKTMSAPTKPIIPEKPATIGRSVLTPTAARPSPIDLPTGSRTITKQKEQLNLRAGLKPRPTADKGGEKEELPFLNAMSRLRSTRTQNYKAPNELKDNILKGKANLSNTGGPQKSNRPDELKESLLSAKVSLKHSDSAPVRTIPEPKPKPEPKLIPKAKSAIFESKPSLFDRKSATPPPGRFEPERRATPPPGRFETEWKPATPPPGRFEQERKPVTPSPGRFEAEKKPATSPSGRFEHERKPTPPPGRFEHERKSTPPPGRFEAEKKSATSPSGRFEHEGKSTPPSGRFEHEGKSTPPSGRFEPERKSATPPSGRFEHEGKSAASPSGRFEHEGKSTPPPGRFESERKFASPLPYVSSVSPISLPGRLEAQRITTPTPKYESERESSPAPKASMERKKSSLADRFNPSLSNLLQRGPPIASSGNAFRGSEESNVSSSSKDLSSGTADQSSTPLSHITKGRAKGPKRRAPTKVEQSPLPATKIANIEKPIDKVPKAFMPETKSARLETPVGPAPVIRELSPAPAETAKNISAPVPSSPELSHKASAASLKTKPPTPIKSPLLRGISSSSFKDAERFQSEPAPIREEVIKTPPPLIRSLSPQGIARQPSFESAENLFKPVKIISQIRLPKRETSRGLAIPGFSDLSSSQEFGGSGPRLFSRSVSPMEDKAEKDDAATDTDNVRQLAQFFKGPSFRSNTIIFDHMSILATSPAIPVEKINTDKFEVSEITGYGKLNPVSEEEQHLFFDESMYLCIHNFEGLSGKKKTEVIFWSGAKVSESATEDAQLFARKVARDNDARLTQLKQGHETPTFFQAVGGILVTRRGTRAKSEPDNSYMLCGRNCFGGIAFDEVDMEVASLCSGFPFIVCRKGGVYLWKGKGATLEEVGIARLVAFGISGGEVKEFAEDDEPDAFFDALGGYSEFKSADYWHLRPSSKKYAARLFRIDLDSHTKVVEIYPFSQDHLDPRGIYVADAFFEFYVVVGSRSQSRREEFQAALQFTKEYSQLAESVEGRPFVPVSSVILGGAPREFKALFRSWDDAKIPTQWQPTRKPSLQLIGLPAAMEAMGV